MKIYWKKISAILMAFVLVAGTVAGAASFAPKTVFAKEEPSKAVSGLSAEDEALYGEMFAAIAKSCDNASDWYALCGAAIGKKDKADTTKILSDALTASAAYKGTNVQTSVLLMSAIGEDPSALSDGKGGTIDLVSGMYSTAKAVAGWAESAAYTLMAYTASGKDIPAASTNSCAALIKTIKDNYLATDGGYGWGKVSSPDTTGAVIASLAAYKDLDGVQKMIDDGVASLKASQNADGGFGYSAGAETNIDSTSLAIIGLCAVGIDPTGSDFTKDGKNPMTALLSFANDTHDGFSMASGNVAYATSDAFRAFVAYSGFRNTGVAYNVYTDAKNAGAAYKVPVKPEPESESTSEVASEAASEMQSVAVASSAVKTGDSSSAFVWIIVTMSCLAAGTFACVRLSKHEK